MTRTRLLIQERATRKSLKLLRHKTKFSGFTPPFLKPTYSSMPQLSLQYSQPHYGNSLNWHYSTIQHSRPKLFALPRSTLTSRRVHPPQPSRKVANHSSFIHEILGLPETSRLPVATLFPSSAHDNNAQVGPRSTTPSSPNTTSSPTLPQLASSVFQSRCRSVDRNIFTQYPLTAAAPPLLVSRAYLIQVSLEGYSANTSAFLPERPLHSRRVSTIRHSALSATTSVIFAHGQ